MGSEWKEFWGKIPLVVLQFSFSNRAVVPEEITRHLPNERPEQKVERKRKTAGRPDPVLIEPTLNVDLAEFVTDLEAMGFALVDDVYQRRLNDPKERKPDGYYEMVRFLLARHENAEPTPEFMANRATARAGLHKMVTDAAWRVRAFVKPYFGKDGKPVAENGVVSINLEVRKALLCPDGKPVVAWQKDAAGNRIGDAPVPVKPDFRLRVVEGETNLVPVK